MTEPPDLAWPDQTGSLLVVEERRGEERRASLALLTSDSTESVSGPGRPPLTMIFFSLLSLLLCSVSPSPIVKILEHSQHDFQYEDYTIPLDHCVLTPKLGYSGTTQFLEECEGIGKIYLEGRKAVNTGILNYCNFQRGSQQFRSL